MENNDHRSIWRFFDGSVSISVSMLLFPSLLASLTERENGIIIVATLLLFPTAAALYGGFAVFFAAKEAVERRAKEKGRQEGLASRARAYQQSAGGNGSRRSPNPGAH